MKEMQAAVAAAGGSEMQLPAAAISFPSWLLPHGSWLYEKSSTEFDKR